MSAISVPESVSSIVTAARVVGRERSSLLTALVVKSPRTARVPETGVIPRMPRVTCTTSLEGMTCRADETQPVEESPVAEEEVAAAPQPVLVVGRTED